MLFNREVGYLIALFFIDCDICIVDKIFLCADDTKCLADLYEFACAMLKQSD